MTYYHNQISKLRSQLYPKDYLTQQVIQAKHFIDKNFAENIHLEDLATAAFLSKFHFIRSFKSLYGTTPYQYLTSVRIRNAKRLLLTHIPIAEVCMAVGFESVTWFTGLFKKITGTTPAMYRKKAISKN